MGVAEDVADVQGAADPSAAGCRWRRRRRARRCGRRRRCPAPARPRPPVLDAVEHGTVGDAQERESREPRHLRRGPGTGSDAGARRPRHRRREHPARDAQHPLVRQARVTSPPAASSAAACARRASCSTSANGSRTTSRQSVSAARATSSAPAARSTACSRRSPPGARAVSTPAGTWRPARPRGAAATAGRRQALQPTSDAPCWSRRAPRHALGGRRSRASTRPSGRRCRQDTLRPAGRLRPAGSVTTRTVDLSDDWAYGAGVRTAGGCSSGSPQAPRRHRPPAPRRRQRALRRRAEDRTVGAATEVLREGRSVASVRTSLVQEGRTKVEALVSLGTLPPAARPVHRPRAAGAADAEDCVESRSTPAFRNGILEQLEIRLDPATAGFVSGPPGGSAECRAWVRAATAGSPTRCSCSASPTRCRR